MVLRREEREMVGFAFVDDAVVKDLSLVLWEAGYSLWDAGRIRIAAPIDEELFEAGQRVVDEARAG